MFVHVAAMSKRHVNGIMHGWIICLWCDMCIACMPVLMTLLTTCLCEFTTVSCNIEWCVWHCIWQLSKWYGAMQPSQLGLAMTQHVTQGGLGTPLCFCQNVPTPIAMQSDCTSQLLKTALHCPYCLLYFYSRWLAHRCVGHDCKKCWSKLSLEGQNRKTTTE